jgi:5'-nucleotidase (lipoprotein e(P4) family)
MRTKNILIKWSSLGALLIVINFFSCNHTIENKIPDNQSYNSLLMAVSWYQHSSEMTALYYQGFNIAKLRLDEAIKTKTSAKPLAVVVDIDETMLDNSPFETLLLNQSYKLSDWYKWTSKASAKALPGALEFANYAQSQKVEIFYITNRDDNERAGTLKNLENQGFPNSDEKHLFTKSDLSESTGNTSSKEGRRNKVAGNFEIALLIGDNLNDFSGLFEDRKINYGKEAVEKNKDMFGKKFIILPNPMYGAWEKPLYDYKDKLSETEKIQLIKSKLKTE